MGSEYDPLFSAGRGERSADLDAGGAARHGPLGVLSLWALAVIVGGALELALAWRHRQPRTGLTTWILRAQGNLSLLAVVLSALLVAVGQAWALPGLWLLLLE